MLVQNYKLILISFLIVLFTKKSFAVNENGYNRDWLLSDPVVNVYSGTSAKVVDLEGPFSSGFASQYASDGSTLDIINIHYSGLLAPEHSIFDNRKVEFQIENHRGQTGDAIFSGHKISASVLFKLNSASNLNVNIGFDQVANSLSEGQASPSFDLVQVFQLDHTALRLQCSYDLFYFSSANRAALKDGLHAQFNSLSSETNFSDSLKFKSSASYQTISDANQMLGFDDALLYKIGDAQAVWIGLGSGLQHYAEYRSAYWTPVRNFSVGPRLETSQKITRNLSAHISASLGCGNDENGQLGWGTYHELGASYQLSSLNLSATYVGMGTTPATAGWFQRSWSVSGSGNF